ncbi:hypothetical protein B0H10DRAFT_2211988 [Mycena sp. CBHHK59/15]|nr:hypothetical protein B0H10DRAFT_2211988 [Mycena sp. CBHHK59/15]
MDLVESSQAFKDTCKAIGSTRGEKLAWTAHILGGKVPCPTVSNKAIADTKAARKDHKEHQVEKKEKKRPRKDSDSTSALDMPAPPPKKQHTQSMLSSLTFCRNEMPFGSVEKDALQGQALGAIVSSGLPFQLFKDPEMKVLFGMLCTMAPDILPMGKVVGRRLLNKAAEKVELNLKKTLSNCNVGLLTDGWKKKKDSVNTICANVDFKAYLLELIDVMELKKDGPSQCKQFAGMIDRVEEKHGCIQEGAVLLGKEHPWLILPSCWAHQFQLILGNYFKVNNAAALIAEDATALIGWLNNHGRVWKIFDESQRIISKDQNNGIIIVPAYLVANLTCWMTHFIAFVRLFILREALRLAVLQNHMAIIAAEVGAATSKEGERLKEDAERMCALIEDVSFWNGLETVLLTITGIFLRFAEHPEEEVWTLMLIRLEKRWKDCDQPVFLLALILNLFKKLSCFGLSANMNQLKCCNLLISVYRRINFHPDNQDTEEQWMDKENGVSRAFLQYLSGTCAFGDFDTTEWEQIYKNTDPIQVWEALVGSTNITELAKFTIIVANQAGCEHTFSRTKIEHSDHRNRLGLEKMDKRTKIWAQIWAEHESKGL